MDEHDRDLEERLRRIRPSHAPDPARAAQLEEALLRHRSWRTRRYRPLAGLALAACLAGALLLLHDRPLGSGGFDLRQTGVDGKENPVFEPAWKDPNNNQSFVGGSSQPMAPEERARIEQTLERANAAVKLGTARLVKVTWVKIGGEESWTGAYQFGPDPVADGFGGNIKGLPSGGPLIVRFFNSPEFPALLQTIHDRELASIGVRDLVIERRAVRLTLYRWRAPSFGEVEYGVWGEPELNPVTAPPRQAH
jgi:hypothetical protein